MALFNYPLIPSITQSSNSSPQPTYQSRPPTWPGCLWRTSRQKHGSQIQILKRENILYKTYPAPFRPRRRPGRGCVLLPAPGSRAAAARLPPARHPAGLATRGKYYFHQRTNLKLTFEQIQFRIFTKYSIKLSGRRLAMVEL